MNLCVLVLDVNAVRAWLLELTRRSPQHPPNIIAMRLHGRDVSNAIILRTETADLLSLWEVADLVGRIQGKVQDAQSPP